MSRAGRRDGNGASAGDQMQFYGFSTAQQGAALTQADAGHWQIHSGLDGHDEMIAISTGSIVQKLVVHASDYMFL